jgi:hypothetical protein|tara:strand:- start:146 stop:526 length:381 start_codon:yes stop_codon:yes gene_type:complete
MLQQASLHRYAVHSQRFRVRMEMDHKRISGARHGDKLNVSKALNDKADGQIHQEDPLLGLKKVRKKGLLKREAALVRKELVAGASLPDGADVERQDNTNRVQSTEDKVAGAQQTRRVRFSRRWVHG